MNEQNIISKYAAVWKRVVAFVIDLVIVVALFSLLICAVNSLLALPVEYASILETGFPLKITTYIEEHFLEIVILYSLLKLAVVFPYFTLLESCRLQATLGKVLCGIKVTDLSGQRISFLRATCRFFARILSGQILLIGYLMAAFTKRKQALHDLIAGTLVINNESVVSIKESLTKQ
jgi:uncharacterized RDD family membrane protein YckC